MNTALETKVKNWVSIYPYVHVPDNRTEYNELLKFANNLMKTFHNEKSKHITSFLKIIAKNIEEYETHHFLTKPASPIEILQFLMEEHGLGQCDLPEIGGQSLISKILSGDRQLTVLQIRKLSKRFGVSPSVFIEGG